MHSFRHRAGILLTVLIPSARLAVFACTGDDPALSPSSADGGGGYGSSASSADGYWLR